LGFAIALFFVPTNKRAVALTLDDGPDPSTTPLVLETLAEHGARATFFLIGERAERNPRLVQQIAESGHELGNHSWKDEQSASLSCARLAENMRRTHNVLSQHGDVRLFRPGGGSIGRGKVVCLAAALEGYKCVLASVYPHDVRIASKDFIVRDVLKRTRSGSIIVLHEGLPERARIAEILDEVLSELRKRYEVMTVSELLERAQLAEPPVAYAG
jgi:peptidoglycan/xylan/chitin deacetylase (PgdA/CDA1 family)